MYPEWFTSGLGLVWHKRHFGLLLCGSLGSTLECGRDGIMVPSSSRWVTPAAQGHDYLRTTWAARRASSVIASS